MAFAILKLSYKTPGDSSLTDGICGTGFFLNSRTAVTAHHVLNDETFTPNAGFRHALVWIVSRSGSILKIQRDSTSFYPHIDATVIAFQQAVRNVDIYQPSGGVADGIEVSGIGHVGDLLMPLVDAEWQGSELTIRSADLTGLRRDTKGYVKRSLTFEINANDTKMHGVRGFELSFGSRVGMSGGPVVDGRTGNVTGMLSAGLPPDSMEKTQTFAVSIDEILKCCPANGT